MSALKMFFRSTRSVVLYSRMLSKNVATFTQLSNTSQKQSKLAEVCIIPHRLFSDTTNGVANFEEVKKATCNNNTLIIDVREPEEIKEHGKIPNSINIPLGNVSTVLTNINENDFQKLYNRSKPTEDTEIIFYCMIGKRSGMAQQTAISLGYKNAKNYLGSWSEWARKT